MATNLQFGALRPEQISFGFSPAQEALVSLHVLFDASHHPLHIHWVIRTRKQLRPALKAELEAFQVLDKKLIADLWIPTPGSGFPSFEDELTQLLRAPIEHYANGFSFVLLDIPDAYGKILHDDQIRRAMMDKAIANFPLSVPVVEEFFDDPLRSRERFCTCIAAYWEACLASEWPRLEEAFLHDIERRGCALLQEGVLGLLSTLSPELHVNLRTGLGVRKGNVEVNVEFNDKDTLVLVPSYFVWPHLLVKPELPYALIYAIQEHSHQGRAPVPPERLLKLIRAAGDMTRLQILQLLSQREHSTRELAGIIGVSEAAISKQLRILQDVNLISPRRESYYVFYSLVQNSLLDLSRGMMQLLVTDPDHTILGE